MSRRGNTAAALASLGVLVTGWSIGTGTGNGQALAQTTGTSSAGGTTNASASTPSATASSTTTTGSSSATSSTSGATGTFTGSTESDRFGSITVTVTLANGTITDVTYTTTVGDPHSAQIEARAIPTLKSEVLKANSAHVSTVGGATYTSDKYLTSLQSALDQAA